MGHSHPSSAIRRPSLRALSSCSHVRVTSMKVCIFAFVFPIAAALQASTQLANNRAVLQSSMSRSAMVTMGEMSTKKENGWKYVKSVNDYGKEQTYMFLSAKEDVAEYDGPSASLSK